MPKDSNNNNTVQTPNKYFHIELIIIRKFSLWYLMCLWLCISNLNTIPIPKFVHILIVAEIDVTNKTKSNMYSLQPQDKLYFVFGEKTILKFR